MSEFLWETIGGTTYWFTSALVVAEIIILVMLITRCRNIWIYWIGSLLVMAIGMYMVNKNVNFLYFNHDFWQFKNGLFSIPFLTAGGLFWKYETHIQKIMNKWIIAIMLIAYIIIFHVWHDDLHVLVSMLDVNWMGYIAGCFASILLIELCKYLPVIKLLTFIGRNSISFYFMSGALPIVLSLTMKYIYDVPSWYGLTIVWLITLIIAYVLTKIFNRYMPWIFDIRRFSSIVNKVIK